MKQPRIRFVTNDAVHGTAVLEVVGQGRKPYLWFGPEDGACMAVSGSDSVRQFLLTSLAYVMPGSTITITKKRRKAPEKVKARA